MEQTPRRTQVLVVGGGPTGLSAASELAHHGIECVVVEPRRTVSHDRPRAKTTSARTMEHFRRWGIVDAVRAAAALSTDWSDRVIFCESLSGEVITWFDGCFGLRTDGLAAERGQQIPQPRVEEVLRAHVATRDQVDLVLGGTVTSIVQSGPGPVVATVRHADGRTETIESEWVLGCDGPTGITRAEVGIELDGRSDPRSNFNVVFRAPGLTTDLGDAVQYWVVGAERPGVLGRLDLDDTWWAIAPGVDLATGAADPSAIVDALVGRRVEHEVISTDPWTARMLVAERYRSGRVFLVGDAAHINPPWGGHGYNTCVGDAVNVAWKLAAVLQGWGGPSLLDRYEQERRPVAEDTIRLATSNMGTLSTDLSTDLSTVPSPDRAAQIQQTKAAEFHSLGLVLGYSYAGSSVVVEDLDAAGRSASSGDTTAYVPSTAPGRLLPHATMPDGRALYDHLGARLSLVGPLSDDPEGVRHLVALATALGVHLELVQAPAALPPHEFLLVRPDQHVADRSRDAGALDLARAVGRAPVPAEVPTCCTQPDAPGLTHPA